MSGTICDKFLQTARKKAKNTAIMYKRGGHWIELTWADYKELVGAAAAGLQILGVRKGDRVAIVSRTRYEWAVCDLAVLGLGGVTVPVYPNSSPDDLAYILSDSEPKIAICENLETAKRVSEYAKNLSSLEHIVYIDGPELVKETVTDGRSLSTWADLHRRGSEALRTSPTLYELAVSDVETRDTASIIYTSGTTGRPQGVVHTHAQILSEVTDAFPLLGVTARDRSLTFLPFAHVLGRIEIYGHALIGYTMAFAQDIERLRTALIDVKPTIMVAVPRVFEKIYSAVFAQAEISRIQKRVFEWALSIGREVSRHKVAKQPLPVDLALKYQLARRLVFKKILDRMGGRLRFAVSGGAPLNPVIAEFFHAAGLLILEGYGLTETMAAITVNTPFEYKFGSVGKAIGDVQLKIAEDGEILVKSKKVMKEYYRNPEATEKAFTDGWFHTGDIGEITSDGFLKILDRKKELIKTAGGKYVAPQKLEALLATHPLISQVHIHGDQRKFVVALVTLNPGAAMKYAEENKISYKSLEDLAQSPKIREEIREAVAEANSQLASFETIKNFAILSKEFSIESGELTPSLKLKRKVIDEHYRDVLDSLYGIQR
mgnify:FL=1